MSREELDLEFLGNEWECGYTYGTQHTDLTEAALLTASAMDRALTPTEMLQFAEGWHEGVADRAAWLADQAAMTPPWYTLEVPF